MTDAVAGHGAEIAMEQDPTGSPGVFTSIAEVNGDIMPPALSREFAEATPHSDDIDSHVPGVLRRDPMTFSVNLLYDNATHDHLTGLIKAMIDKENRGFRVRGPQGVTADDGTDEWICSGHISNLSPANPVRTGVRTMEVEVVMSGPMLIDGVTVN